MRSRIPALNHRRPIPDAVTLMIVFDLQCRDGGETFEAWFRSSADYDEQRAAGWSQCPFCQSAKVAKAPMAPRVPRKGSGNPLARLAALQAEMLKDSRWVGDEFTETARAMHSGEIEPEQVHGNATLEQAKSLVDDGVPVAPLPLPVDPAEPGQLIGAARSPYSSARRPRSSAG